MKHAARAMVLLLAVLFCILPVRAAESENTESYFTEWADGLDQIMAEYMEAHGLSAQNFAMGYLYTGTGEYWYFNQDKVMTAGSIYKVPLNMRITEMVASGERSWDDHVYGMPLAEAQRMSITYSKNEVSYALQSYCAGFNGFYYPAYRAELLKYSGWTESQIPENYYTTNTFTASFMLTTLSILYQDAALYSNIIGYMKDAYPGRYFRLYEGDYTIAHKYGAFGGAVNDIAIVYTPTPFLLVVMTQYVENAEQVLGELCRLMTDYTLSLDAKYEAERQADIAVAAALAQSLAAEEAEASRQALLIEQAEIRLRELSDSFALSAMQLCLP